MIRIVVQDEPTGRALAMNAAERVLIRVQSLSYPTGVRSRPKIVGVSLICHYCKTEMAMDASYCTECGRLLRMRTTRS